MQFKYLFIFFAVCSLLRGEVWLIEQEFVKFGKRDVYEVLKKGWDSKYRTFLNKEERVHPILAVEDFDAPQYIYLTPLTNYTSLNHLEIVQKNFRATLNEKEIQPLESTLNFRIASLSVYLPECSYIPEGNNCSFSNLPYVRYQIFSLTPGSESLFEEHLQKVAFEEANKRTQTCWRSWRVAFGSDVPKYLVCIFANTKEGLEKEDLYFVHQGLKEIVRRQKEGKGIFRKDLSILVPSNLQ